jgi:hypothetical protein
LLSRLSLFVASWGLPLPEIPFVWRRAYAKDGVTYDLRYRNGRLSVALADPVIERDQQGRIVSGKYGTREEAEHAAQRIVEREGGGEVKVEDFTDTLPALTGLATAIEIGPDLQRLALKCLLGTATLLPGAGRRP